jgi:hypothetical protein
VREDATGVWHWRASHPEWKPGQTWGRMVSSYAVDTGEGVLLFDPLGIPAELRERATAPDARRPRGSRGARARPFLTLTLSIPSPDVRTAASSG